MLNKIEIKEVLLKWSIHLKKKQKKLLVVV